MTCGFSFKEWDFLICLRMSWTWTTEAMLSMDRFYTIYWKQSSTEVTESGPGPAEQGYVTNPWVVDREDFKLWQGVKSAWGWFSCTNKSTFHWYWAAPLTPFSYQTGGVFPQKYCAHQSLLVLGGVKAALVSQLPWGGGGWMQRLPVHIFYPSPRMPFSQCCLPGQPSQHVCCSWGRYWPSSSGNRNVRVPQTPGTLPTSSPHWNFGSLEQKLVKQRSKAGWNKLPLVI